MRTEVGLVGLEVPRDRDSSFEPGWCPRVRDIGHRQHRTLGVELSHDTISKMTDAVLDEVKAWQPRHLT